MRSRRGHTVIIPRADWRLFTGFLRKWGRYGRETRRRKSEREKREEEKIKINK